MKDKGYTFIDRDKLIANLKEAKKRPPILIKRLKGKVT